MSTQDTLDDDDERVTLSFGAMPDERVSEGTPNATSLEIDDDDDPEVTVSFALSSYRVGEGSSVTVTTVPQRASLFSVASGPIGRSSNQQETFDTCCQGAQSHGDEFIHRPQSARTRLRLQGTPAVPDHAP